jgi:dihydroorotate dehydrogenase (fumarate)
MDLSTKYLGLSLKSPLVVSPSPLTEEVGNIKQMEDAGAAAVVIHSLFAEQLMMEKEELDQALTQGTDSFAEALTYFPEMEEYKLGPDEYTDLIRKAKEAVDIPIIGSLNGVSTGGWIDYAKKIEEAGADALELNIYYLPTDPSMTSAKLDQMHVDLVRGVKDSVGIPLAVKLGPFFSSMPSVAVELDKAGADALVLFNRFYQPDIDIDKLEVVPNLVLSTSDELRLRLRWVAILYGHIEADMAITGGVHTPEDVVKAMMVGAKVAMMTSAVLANGIDHLGKVRDGLSKWMEKHDYDSVAKMQGTMSQKKVAEPAAFERANYMKVLHSYRDWD